MDNPLNLLEPRLKLNAVRDWQELIRITESKPTGITNQYTGAIYRDLFDKYCLDLEYRAGMSSPYTDNVDRMVTLRELRDEINPLLDDLAGMDDGDGNVPVLAREVCQVLFGIGFDITTILGTCPRRTGQNSEAAR